MTTQIHLIQESHVDHGLSNEQLEYVLANCVGLEGDICIDTIELPGTLGTAPCALYGPLVGDEPIAENKVSYVKRGERAGKSRVIDAPARETNKITVISGPDGNAPCVLYTAFGGPHAPLELFQSDDEQAKAFWQDHALAVNLSEARIAELEALVSEWQDATGLVDANGAGDPSAITPRHLEKELDSLRGEVAGMGHQIANMLRDQLNVGQSPPDEPAAERWCHGDCEEEFSSGDFATREDAIADGRAEYEGQSFYSGQAVQPDAAAYAPDTEFIRDVMHDNACADCNSDFVGHWPKEDAAADAELESLLESWSRKHHKPTWFLVSDVVAHEAVTENQCGESDA